MRSETPPETIELVERRPIAFCGTTAVNMRVPPYWMTWGTTIIYSRRRRFCRVKNGTHYM